MVIGNERGGEAEGDSRMMLEDKATQEKDILVTVVFGVGRNFCALVMR